MAGVGDYPNQEALDNSAEFLLETTNGTKNIRWDVLKGILEGLIQGSRYLGEFDPVAGIPVEGGLRVGDYRVSTGSGTFSEIDYLPGDKAVWKGAWTKERRSFSGGFRFRGEWDADLGEPYSPLLNDIWKISGDGSFGGRSWAVNDYVLYNGAEFVPLGGSGDGSGGVTFSTLAGLNSLVSDATLIDTGDSRLSDARTPTSHTHTLSEVTDSGTAAALDVAASGDAASGEVVKGSDTRLSDARTPTSHSHTASDVTDFESAVSANSAVAANTAKVTNATHTGDATGSGALEVVGLRGVGLDSSVGTPSDGNVLVYRSAGSDWVLEAKPTSSGSPAWGEITGTLSAQTDLQAALDACGDMSASTYDPNTVAGDAFDMDNMAQGANNKFLSALNYTDLQNGGDSALHYHASDRNRDNHTGTQTLSTISDAGSAAAKGVTGSDANAVTGTAGTNGNLVSWNADGDAVDSGVAASGVKTTRTGVYRTIWIDAGAMVPRTTDGAEADTEENATNDIMADVLLFDGATTNEGAQWKLAMPDEWDRGTIKAKVFWDAATGASAADGVVWSIAAGALSNDDAIDTALGTAQTVTDTVIAVGDLHVTSATAAITVGGTPALGDLTVFEIERLQDNGSDTMAEDAKLLGVQIQYAESSTEPSIW